MRLQLSTDEGRKKMTVRIWLMISLGAQRQYGGNGGYADRLGKRYVYDSSVGNHTQVNEGDLVLIRDRISVQGVGRIRRISSRAGTKRVFRCPRCRTLSIKQRSTLQPRWRCANGHAFKRPKESSRRVTLFAADYGGTFVRFRPEISAERAKAATMRPSDQLSIEELDGVKLLRTLDGDERQNARALARLLFSAVAPEFRSELKLMREEENSYVVSGVDEREFTMRAIAARKGQPKFRRELARRYGARCMVSGCSLYAIVEAAHIRPFRGPKDHHGANGLLLRADLHTLYDNDLMGVHPKRLTVHFKKNVQHAGYAAFEGASLAVGRYRPSFEALKRRWAVFAKSPATTADRGSEKRKAQS